MNIKKIQKILTYTSYGLGAVLVGLIILSGFVLESNKKPQAEIDRTILNTYKQAKGFSVNENLPQVWPPQMNKIYPDLALIDQTGNPFMLSDLRGKIIVVENVDMTSPVSQAQSGAATVGTYGNIQEFDAGAKPFAELLYQHTDNMLTWPNANIVLLKVIYYNAQGGQATALDARGWAEHFGLRREDNIVVAVPQKDLRDKETTDIIIPGFQLIDRGMNLRVDSSGATPKHNLEMTLIPLIPKLL